MPTGGVMSPRLTPAWQRVCGVSTCFMSLEISSAHGRLACADTCFFWNGPIVSLTWRSFWKQWPARIEQGPADRIGGEDAGDHEKRRKPAAGAILHRSRDIVEQGGAKISGHVHDAENRRDP